MGETSFLQLDPFDETLERSALNEAIALEDEEIRRREAELRRLELLARTPEPGEEGAPAPALDFLQAPAPPVVEEPDDAINLLSETIRSTMGGVLGEIRDIVVNLDLLTDASLTALGILEEDEKAGILGLQTLLPDVAQPETAAGRVVRGLVEFGTGFLLFGAAGRAAGISSRFLLSTLASGAEAGLGRGADEARLTDVITELAPSLEDDRIIGGLVQFLQTSEDETALEAFGKNVVEDVLLGLGFEGATLVASRLVENLRPGVVRGLLQEERGAVGPRGDVPGRPGEPEPEDIVPPVTPLDEAARNTEQSAPAVEREITRDVNQRLAAGEPLEQTAEQGDYSIDIVAQVAGTRNQTNPVYAAVANFTTDKASQIQAAARDALENGFTTQNRQVVYTTLMEMIQGYDKFTKTIAQGRQVVTPQLVEDLGRPSRYVRNLMRMLQNGEMGIDEPTFFRELAQNPARLAQVYAANSRNFRQLTADVLTELFYSGALSAPATLIRAGLGAPVLFAYETAANVVGGVLTFNRTGLLGEAWADVQGVMQGLADGIRVMAKNVGEDESANLAMEFRGVRVQNPITINARNFGASGMLGSAINALGRGIRFPTRVLGAIDKGTEEVVRRVVLNRTAFQQARAAVTATGARGAQARVLHRNEYNRVLEAGLNDEIIRVAKTETRRLTLSNDLADGRLKELNNLINSSPFLRIMFPFVRVSTNAMITSIEKTPVLAFIQRRQREMLTSGDPDQLARLAGTQALSAGIMGAVAWMTVQGFVTGAAPQNPSLRAAWELSGRKEYSFNFPTPGGDVVSIQYARFGEPFGFLMGTVADLVYGFQHLDQKLQEIDNPEERNAFFEASEVVGLAFAQNFSKKTFLQSVVDFSQALTDPGRFASKFAANTLTTFIPAGGLLRAIDRELHPELPEVDTFVERVKSRVPYFNRDLPPRRNLFGEPVEYQPGFAAAFVDPELAFGMIRGTADIFSPVIGTMVDPDDEAVAIGNVIRQNNLTPAGVRTPATFRGVGFTDDERDFIAQRRGEIRLGDLTLKQALFRLIQNPQFQTATPGNDGIQEAMMSRVIRSYNQAAIAEALTEFAPILDRLQDRLVRIGLVPQSPER